MTDTTIILGSKIVYSGTSNVMDIEEWRSYLGFAGFEGRVKRHRAVLVTTANRVRCGEDRGNYGWTRDGTPIHLLWDYFNGEWVTKAELAALYRCDVGDVLSHYQFAKLDTAQWIFDDADHLNAWSARERGLDWQNAPYQEFRDLGPGAQPEPRLDFPPGDETKGKKSIKVGLDKEATDRAAHEAKIQDDMAEIDRVMGREATARPLPPSFPFPLAPTQAGTRTRARTEKGGAISRKGKEVATEEVTGEEPERADGAAEEAVGGKRKFETILEPIEEGDEAEEDPLPAAKRSRVGTPEIPAANPAAETVVEDEEKEVEKEESGNKGEAVEEKEVGGKEKKKRGRKPASKTTAPPPTRVTRSMSRQRSQAPHGGTTDGPADLPARRPTRPKRERNVTAKAAELQEGGKWSRSGLKKTAK